jgi:predicted nuclease of restriction endonuclease-like (RecB) superfamily
LSWKHYRTLLRLDGGAARNGYVDESIQQNWSSRALERQMGTLYYERLLASQDKAAVVAEAGVNIAALPGTGRALESNLEQG